MTMLWVVAAVAGAWLVLAFPLALILGRLLSGDRFEPGLRNSRAR